MWCTGGALPTQCAQTLKDPSASLTHWGISSRPASHKDLNVAVLHRDLCGNHGGGGGAGTGPFTPTPPPPSLLGFGPEVPDHGRRRCPKEILLDLVEGEKMGFHPMCLYSKYSVFFRRTH